MRKTYTINSLLIFIFLILMCINKFLGFYLNATWAHDWTMALIFMPLVTIPGIYSISQDIKEIKNNKRSILLGINAGLTILTIFLTSQTLFLYLTFSTNLLILTLTLFILIFVVNSILLEMTKKQSILKKDI